MKKLISTLLVIVTVFCFTPMAFAANQTVLNTTVPDATYTLNIPASQTIDFGVEDKEIGELTVTEASGFAVGKDLKVTLTYDELSCEDTSTTIPYSISFLSTIANPTTRCHVRTGGYVTFLGRVTGETTRSSQWQGQDKKYEVGNTVSFNAESSDWGKALAGDYTSTITFTAEVVSNAA